MRSLIITLFLGLYASLGMGNCHIKLFELIGTDDVLGSFFVKRDHVFSGTQAERLKIFFDELSEEQYQQIFGDMDQQALRNLSDSIQTGDLEEPFKSAINDNPNLESFLSDIVSFGDSFPGIFELSDAFPTIKKVLLSVRKSEIVNLGSREDLLVSQSMSPRLSRTINNTLINLIQQGTQEYSGMTFGARGLEAARDGIRRFFFPTYYKTRDILKVSQFFQKQLERYRKVDYLVVTKILGDPSAAELSSLEYQEISNVVLDSPDQIEEVSRRLSDLFQNQFDLGEVGEIGSFEISEIAARARGVSLDGEQSSFDNDTIRSLELVEDMINRIRTRRGLSERPKGEFDITELRLRYEAFRGRALRRKEAYLNHLNEASRESYRVERRRTRYRTETYRDSSGKMQTRRVPETYYVDETVVPTFRDLITNSFDRGDRLVSGLDRIIIDSSALRDKEYPIYRFHEYLNRQLRDLDNSYQKLVTLGRDSSVDKTKEDFLSSLEAVENEIKDFLTEINRYLEQNNTEVLNRYGRDDTENFRSRNNAIKEYVTAMGKLFDDYEELLRRNEPQRTPVFDLWDYGNWMRGLRRHATRAHLGQAGLGVGAVGASVGYIVYENNEDFQTWVNENFSTIKRLLNK